MPIRESEKHRYPKNWKEIRARIQIRAKNCCEFCGVKNHSIGYRAKDGTFYPEDGSAYIPDDVFGSNTSLMKIVCTTAHLNHSPEDNRDENLAFLCQRCHLTYDAKHHALNAAATRRRKKNNLELFDLILSAATVEMN